MSYSLILISPLAIMAVNPPVVMPLLKILRMTSGIFDMMSGTNSTLIPKEKLIAMTRTALRVIFVEAMMRMPAAATVPNMSSVAPPNTRSFKPYIRSLPVFSMKLRLLKFPTPSV